MDPLAGKSILILEEQPEIGSLLAEIVKDFGCRIVGPVTRQDEALSLLSSAHVDAAVLDVKIEGQATGAVADNLVVRRIPWAFATSDRANTFAARFSEVPVITKPFSADHLRDVLSALLLSPAA